MGHRSRRAAPGVVRDWSKPRFLFVGVEWRRKNGAAVVRAFEEVRKLVPAATLDLVGNHPEIDAPGVTGHGFLARGDVSAQLKLDRLYAEASCFVLPSRFDPSPIAYLEAASAGLPVIATSRGGAGELIKDGAIVVDPGDSRALVHAMLFLADPSAAQLMGSAAARNAATSSWADVADRIVEALGLHSQPVGSGGAGDSVDV
ncbi:glycosyltransferase family 4 protein [Arthrobacter sp. NPDC080031]|uniref:glycosyltransferase family 4 protein n=1 Tax=Arthrobacter sp. NPDC080031 TaxID=3155918 RepID=UPI00344BFB8E